MDRHGDIESGSASQNSADSILDKQVIIIILFVYPERNA